MSFKAPRVRGRRRDATTPTQHPTPLAVPASQGWQVVDDRPVGDSRGLVFPHIDVQTSLHGLSQVGTTSMSPVRTPGAAHTVSSSRTPSPRKQVPDRRLRLLANWSHVLEEVIPTYLGVLRTTVNLRDQVSPQDSCACIGARRYVEVRCMSFTTIEKVRVCGCSPTKFLIKKGFFPSTPLRPTFAVDMRLLKFIEELHYRSPPNVAAASAALVASLEALGFRLKGQDVVRRKLGHALRFHTLLTAKTEEYIRKKLVTANLSLHETLDTEGEGGDSDEGEWEELPAGDYLALCCPLCFGGATLHDKSIGVDVIVCIDACFTHKRRKPARGKGVDAPLIHPRSLFLTAIEIAAARALVEALRPISKPSTAVPATDGADVVEPGMKVSAAVLNACHESFTAADEKRNKSSSQYFADTGLMALLCRHDAVLWLANMTTPGERQFYAIALITKLFTNLPSDVTVGILYDIGCQLDRSCRKWDFLPEYSPRISWGISIFHAYGHQWPCQLVYHPRKCSGFGLSDSEGCERFWSSIQFLIPTLRVSGYHARIFRIDVQVRWQQAQTRLDLTKWILRKAVACQARMATAEKLIQDAQVPESTLRLQWSLQVMAQTQPLVAATTGLAKKSIKEILQLQDYSKELKANISVLSKAIDTAPKAVGDPEDSLGDSLIQWAEAVASKASIDAQIEWRRRELGVADKANLKRMMDNKYLQVRLQAKALKDRIESKVRNRKFELERLNRAYHNASASERHLQAHVTQSFTGSQPNVVSLVKKYNSFCSQIEALINRRAAPHGAVAPKLLDPHNLFTLDVDDPIWNDCGLSLDQDAEVPLWLGNDAVRGGIQGVLLRDRCKEEKVYLQRELNSLAHWFSVEWGLVDTVLSDTDDEDLVFHLNRMRSDLLYLGAVWHHDASKAPLLTCPNYWGATESQFKDAMRNRDAHAAGDDSADEDTSDGSHSSIGVDGMDDEMLQLLEDFSLNDDYSDLPALAGDSFPFSSSTTPHPSPKKRARALDDEHEVAL